MDARPIGIFDSGMGGVSLLRDARMLLPTENFIYYGDNLNAPYGDRTEEEILALTENSADFLLQLGVKALVIACNTATSASINVLRKRLDVPVISVEPAIKPVLNLGISGIVARIESGTVADDAFDDIFDAYLAPYHGMKADGIVLGCTHYIFIARAVERYFKKHFCGECRLFDGNSATVRQLGRVLEQSNLGNFTGCGKVAFHTSGNSEKLKPVFDMLLDMPIYKQGEE